MLKHSDERHTPTRVHVDLSGYWRFKADRRDEGLSLGWQYALPPDSDLLWVPANWNEQVHDYAWYDGVGWYETEFNVCPTWVARGQAPHIAFVCFEGVLATCQVWLDGEFLGSNRGGFLPFRLRLPELEPLNNGFLNGGTHRLVVRVDSRDDLTLPDFRGDFKIYGGIYRDVFIEILPEVHIADIVVRTDKRTADGEVSVTTTVKNVSGRHFDGQVALTLLRKGTDKATHSEGGGDSKEAGRVGGSTILTEKVMISCKSGQNSEIPVRFEVKNARFWSPGDPALYSLVVRVYDGNDKAVPVDTLETLVGIRKVEVRSDGFYLNDQKTYLQGFSRHECFPVVGKTVKGAILRRELDALKRMGANVFRTAHYPHCRETYDLADRLGIMVIDESCFLGGTKEREGSATVREGAREMLKRLIERDRNHPSVVVWSVANEPENVVPEVAGLVRELMDYARELDGTRPVTMSGCDFDWAGDPDVKGESIIEDLAIEYSDWLDIHNYPGWYDNCGKIDAGVAKFSKIVDLLYQKHRKPVFIGEFGAEGILGFHSDPPEMWTEEYQAEAIRQVTEMIRSKPFVAGFMIWNLADFRTEQSPLRAAGNRKGVLTRVKDPKLAARVVTELFRQKSPSGE